MKLKKIASLMLAGVMAVSMLAGCSGKTTNNGNSTPDPETPVASSASTNLYNELSADTRLHITSAKANSDLDKALNNALEVNWNDSDLLTLYKNAYEQKDPYYVASFVNTGLYNDVAKAMKCGTVFDGAFDNTKGDVTVVKTYYVGGGQTEKGALHWLADAVDKDVAGKLPVSGVKDSVNYEYDYSISASVASQSRTIMGTDFTLWIVSVAVTQTATEA